MIFVFKCMQYQKNRKGTYIEAQIFPEQVLFSDSLHGSWAEAMLVLGKVTPPPKWLNKKAVAKLILTLLFSRQNYNFFEPNLYLHKCPLNISIHLKLDIPWIPVYPPYRLTEQKAVDSSPVLNQISQICVCSFICRILKHYLLSYPKIVLHSSSDMIFTKN